MLFTVLHFKVPPLWRHRLDIQDDPMFMANAQKVEKWYFNGDEGTPHYERVAEVECKSLDDVYEKTNHIHTSWTENAEIVKTFQDNVRSTSVGDVILDMDGNKWFVAPVGFELFDKAA